MSQTKSVEGATPRPWRVWPDALEICAHSPDDNADIAYVYQYDGVREIGEAEANAALIVTAVNEYDSNRARIEKLEAALKYPRFGNTANLLDKAADCLDLEAAKTDSTSIITPHMRRAANDIRAALESPTKENHEESGR